MRSIGGHQPTLPGNSWSYPILNYRSLSLVRLKARRPFEAMIPLETVTGSFAILRQAVNIGIHLAISSVLAL